MILKSTFFWFLGLMLLNADLYAQKTLYVGTLQFPPSLETIPNVRVYYAGHKIGCENDDDAKKVVFSIPELKERALFYLLISPDIEFFSHENTVPFLKLKKNCKYKFYVLQRIPCENKSKKKRNDLGQQEYTWIIKELDLCLPDGRIPDDTIIVRYYPEFIQSIEGGNAIEFPKIIIKPDIIKLVGTQQKLHDISNRLFLAALNIDTIHDTTQLEYIINTPKTIIAMAV